MCLTGLRPKGFLCGLVAHQGLAFHRIDAVFSYPGRVGYDDIKRGGTERCREVE